MTEAEWLACADPLPMVNLAAPRVSDRKLRLFQVACCRRVWHLLGDPRFREAVEVAEGYVEGLCSAGRLAEAAAAAGDVVNPLARRVNVRLSAGDHAASHAVITACFRRGELARLFRSSTGRYATGALLVMKGVDAAAEAAARWAAREQGRGPEVDALLAEERIHQSRLLRDVVGNPFRRVALQPAWLAANDGAALGMARAIYAERALPGGTLDESRLGILADALEDAGCGDADVLGHLRAPGPHTRGCWVVDLLLGRG
jgi:hypothetical protein